MKLYRKKPDTVEAVRWNGDNSDEVAEFLGRDFSHVDGDQVWFSNHSVGANWITTGDYIVKDSGGFYGLSEHRFACSFEPLV